MKQRVKKVIKKAICSAVSLSSRTRVGEYVNEQVLSVAMNRVTKVAHSDIKLTIITPNTLCNWRAKTFSTKEPETLQWIDNIPEKSIFWDIGANIGLYSLYAAKKRSCHVWSFEPGIFNLELLARNIFLNGLTDQICIVPIALSEQLGENQFRMTTTEWGGALSTFGEKFGWNGKNIQSIFEFKTIGLSMADAVQNLGITQPDYIKMDVDGIEHLILKGGLDLLKKVKSVLIEVNDDFHEQADQCQEILSSAGLVLDEKRQSDMLAGSTAGFQNTYNQIWSRR